MIALALSFALAQCEGPTCPLPARIAATTARVVTAPVQVVRQTVEPPRLNRAVQPQRVRLFRRR